MTASDWNLGKVYRSLCCDKYHWKLKKTVAILDKKFKFFIVIFLNFNSSFLLKKIFHFNILLGRGFLTILFFCIFLNIQNVIVVRNTSVVKKKSHFRLIHQEVRSILCTFWFKQPIKYQVCHVTALPDLWFMKRP